MPYDYHLLVIGAGSGGLAAAERAASYGANVAIAEQASPGGACVNYGCIPEKLLDFAASFNDVEPLAASFGWNVVNRSFNWSAFMQAKNNHIQHLNEVHFHKLEKTGVEVLQGHASFVDAHTLNIANRHLTAEKILIAVGAKPAKPEIPGIEHTITWRELYDLPEQPNCIAIVGGNWIGVKVAGSLNALGSQVTHITAEERILPGIDHQINQCIQKQLVQRGVSILTQTIVEKIEPQGDRFSLTLKNSTTENLVVDTVLVDALRIPDLTNLCLASVRIEQTAKGNILVGPDSRTTQPNIFAVGDCTGRIALTPSAIAQARAFADREFGAKAEQVNLDWVPLSISSHPEAATVGFSEEQARKKFGAGVTAYCNEFRPLRYCLAQTEERSLLKLVVNKDDSERVLGIHIVGDGAVEIVQSLAIALRLGATKRDFDQAIGIHPSSAEEMFAL